MEVSLKSKIEDIQMAQEAICESDSVDDDTRRPNKSWTTGNKQVAHDTMFDTNDLSQIIGNGAIDRRIMKCDCSLSLYDSKN